jgi:hypothetical protein
MPVDNQVAEPKKLKIRVENKPPHTRRPVRVVHHIKKQRPTIWHQ